MTSGKTVTGTKLPVDEGLFRAKRGSQPNFGFSAFAACGLFHQVGPQITNDLPPSELLL